MLKANKQQPKSTEKASMAKPTTMPTTKPTGTSSNQLAEHIRIIAADHPEQTIQLLKHWIKD